MTVIDDETGTRVAASGARPVFSRLDASLTGRTG